MKLIRTLVFMLVFAAVLTVYFIQVRLAKQTLMILPDEVNRTVNISKSDLVDRVELRDHVQKTKIALRKKDGAWMMERPVRYPAESQIVEGFAVAARMASQQARLRAEKNWEEYGLEKPEMEVLFGLPGKRTVTLLFGGPSPIGKAVFARWKEERGFFLLPPEMKAMFRQTVYALRQKSLFRLSPDLIRKVTVEMGPNIYQWKKEGDTWYWLEPVSRFGQTFPAESMAAVLGGLGHLNVREFQDQNQKPKSELGFFMIHDLIRIEAEDGKKETFYFGNEVPEKNAYYGFREGEEAVFLVDRANVIAFMDLIKMVQTEKPKLETKDLSAATPEQPPAS